MTLRKKGEGLPQFEGGGDFVAGEYGERVSAGEELVAVQRECLAALFVRIIVATQVAQPNVFDVVRVQGGEEDR